MKSGKRILSSGVTALQYVSKDKKQLARCFRKESTPAEKKLWEFIRNRQVGGLKFRRQQIIDGFIADFYCESAKMVIEVDGEIHQNEKQKRIDEHRGKVFRARGIYTMRLTNRDVLNNIDKCLLAIESTTNNRVVEVPFPSPGGEGCPDSLYESGRGEV